MKRYKAICAIAILAVLLLCGAVWALSNAMWGVVGQGVNTTSESNVTIAGDTGDQSGGSDALIGVSQTYNLDAYTSNAQTSTLRYGYLRTGAATTATSIVMSVYVSGNLVESVTRAWADNTVLEFVFSGTNQIAGGSSVRIAVAVNGYAYVKYSSSWKNLLSATGTYSSPASTLAIDTDGYLSLGIKECYIRNWH